ncbi:MAG TPA: type II secretion system protein N [Povalibacter sp.]|nr:type II secretion system protein N [Povalibacter sp.]
MKRIWPLAVLGILAYVVFALATLPATVLVSRLAPAISAAGVEGTVWRGSAQLLQAGNISLGSARWNLHVLPLFIARVKADVEMKRSDGFAQTTVTLTSGRIRLEQVTASLPLSALPPAAAPGGWSGTINLKLASLTLEKGWPTQAEGTLETLDLTGPARRPANLGSYTASFDGEQTEGEVVGMLSDLGGPLEIVGAVRLKPDRSYVIEGVVATRPDAPKSISDTLQYLGPADEQGRRPFSIAGTM